MNLKKTALKGALILTIVIALCMFFSQTILTITTPKVKLISTKRGRIEQKFTVESELYYPSSETFTLDEAKTLPAVIKSVYVRAGDEVRKGDLIIATRLLPAADEVLEKAREELQKALDQQVKTLTENANRKPKDTQKNEAERALEDAQKALFSVRGEVIAAAHDVGVTLSADASKWRDEIPVGSELLKLVDQMDALALAEQEALASFLAAHKKVGNNNNYTLTKKLADEQRAVDKAQAQYLQVALDMENVKFVRAPRDGVVAAIDATPGEPLSGDKPAFTLAASTPVLRADVSEIRRDIVKDMAVEIKLDYYTLTTKVTEIKRESAVKKYALIEITEEILRDFGGYRGLAADKPKLKITYLSPQTMPLLPTNAVREEGSGAYVLIVEDQSSFWGQERKVRRQDVHVVERSDTQCAIEEEFYGQFIADGEDRPIKDGSRVMEYLAQ